MGISSSLNAGVSGLNANANKLATISDNIANSQTNGYKRADVDFSSLAVSDNSAPNTIGGGRWFTAGGVRTSAVWDIGQKGALTTTANSTDIAIAGRGMLPVTSIASVDETGQELPLMLTSTGSFDTDANGYLRTSSGLVLLGWAANPDGTIPGYPRDSAQGLTPVQVNLSGVAAEPTKNIDLNVNLPATATQSSGDGTVQTVTTEYFDNLGASHTMSFAFSPSVAAAGAAQTNTWTLDITDQATGLAAGSYRIVFDDSAGNAGNMLSVTQLSGGTAPLSTSYDAASGDLTLGLGNQTISVGIGSTIGGPQHLSQLASTFSQTGVSKDGSGGGHLCRPVARRERHALRHLLERLQQGDLPDPGRRRAEPQRAHRARQPDLHHLARLGLALSLGRGRGPGRGDEGLCPRAVDDRHRRRAHPPYPDPARLFLERQDHPDGGRDAAGNHQSQALSPGAMPDRTRPVGNASHEFNNPELAARSGRICFEPPPARGPPMSISSALNNAASGLAAQTRLAETISNNVANALTTGYARRTTELSSVSLGGYGQGVAIGATTRAENATLTAERRGMDAALGASGTRSDAYDRILTAIGDTTSDTAVATLATGLETALMTAAASPQSTTALAEAVSAAKDSARAINRVSDETGQLRTEADAEIGRQVTQINAAPAPDRRAERQDHHARSHGRRRREPRGPARATRRQRGRDRADQGGEARGREVALFTRNGGVLLDGKVYELAFTPAATPSPLT